jgi:hypothetical protein
LPAALSPSAEALAQRRPGTARMRGAARKAERAMMEDMAEVRLGRSVTASAGRSRERGLTTRCNGSGCGGAKPATGLACSPGHASTARPFCASCRNHDAEGRAVPPPRFHHGLTTLFRIPSLASAPATRSSDPHLPHLDVMPVVTTALATATIRP